MLATHVAVGPQTASRAWQAGSAQSAAGAEKIELLANEIVATIPDDFALAFDDAHALNEPTLDGLSALVWQAQIREVIGRRAHGSHGFAALVSLLGPDFFMGRQARGRAYAPLRALS